MLAAWRVLDPAPAPRIPWTTLALLVVGCGPKRVAPAEAEVIRYEIELAVETHTRVQRVAPRAGPGGDVPPAPLPPAPLAPAPADAAPDLAGDAAPDTAPGLAGDAALDTTPEPAPGLAGDAAPDTAPEDPVLAAFASLGQDRAAVQLAVELSPSQAYDDGSLGWLVRFVEARSVAPAAGAPATLPLAGRSVELRTFPDGEVLALADAEHLVGPGRMGEVVDLLLPILSPFPPPLPEGATARRTTRWPFTLEGNNGWRHAVYAEWRNLGLAQTELGEAWHLSWQGPLEGGGKDRRQELPIGVVARGEGQGEVWLGTAESTPVPLRVLRHDFQWRRDAEIEFPAAEGGPVRVYQEQVVQGQLLRRSPPVAP